MKCGWFVLVVMVFMLAAGSAMAGMDTPDEGGGGPGWWLPRIVKDLGGTWRGAPRGQAKPWVGLGYAVKPSTVTHAYQSSQVKRGR